jgi:hypothetical protein
MNLTEGSRRIQLVGRLLTFYALSAAVLFAGLFAIFAMIASGSTDGIARLAISLLFALACLSAAFAANGAIIWLAGWIVEGFGKDRQ